MIIHKKPNPGKEELGGRTMKDGGLAWQMTPPACITSMASRCNDLGNFLQESLESCHPRVHCNTSRSTVLAHAHHFVAFFGRHPIATVHLGASAANIFLPDTTVHFQRCSAVCYLVGAILARQS